MSVEVVKYQESVNIVGDFPPPGHGGGPGWLSWPVPGLVSLLHSDRDASLVQDPAGFGLRQEKEQTNQMKP